MSRLQSDLHDEQASLHEESARHCSDDVERLFHEDSASIQRCEAQRVRELEERRTLDALLAQPPA